MIIGIISDIHSNIYGLKAVLNRLHDVDNILCAGDIIGYYTFVNETIDSIRKNNIKFILGNQDIYLLKNSSPKKSIIVKAINYTSNHITPQNLEFLSKSKSHKKYIFDNKKIALYHGSPWGMEYIYPDYKEFSNFRSIDADVIIIGHTHHPFIHKVGKKLIINPGSCGQPRDYNMASYAIYDTKTGKAMIYRVRYDIGRVAEAAKKVGFPQETIDILYREKKWSMY